MWRRIPAVTLPIFLLFLIATVTVPAHAQEPAEGARKILTHVTPQYPAAAHNLHLGGVVKVEAVVLPNGSVKSVEIKGGHPLLAQSAQNAVREWKWAPGPRETHEELEIKFTPE
jgi:TonB family protein